MSKHLLKTISIIALTCALSMAVQAAGAGGDNDDFNNRGFRGRFTQLLNRLPFMHKESSNSENVANTNISFHQAIESGDIDTAKQLLIIAERSRYKFMEISRTGNTSTHCC